MRGDDHEPRLTPEQAALALAMIRGDDPYQGEGQSPAQDDLVQTLEAIVRNID